MAELLFSMAEPTATKSETFRRYGLVALAFLHIAVGRGLHGTFGVFFVAMLDAFGWSRATTAGAISLAIIFEGACLPWAGGLIDRIGGRKTLISGGVVLFIGLSLASTITAVWQLYFWIGIVSAAGIALIGMVPHVAIISREFPKRRGTALGIAWAGGGVGIVLLVPVTQLMINNWGWSTAYVGLAGITVLLVIPAVLIFLPKKKAAAVEAHTPVIEPNPSGKSAAAADWTVKRALTNSAFWLLFIARTLASMGNQVIVTHTIAHAVDVGYTKVFAASIFGLMGVVSIGGRILFGYLADVMNRQMVFTSVQIISAFGVFALLAMHDNYAALAALCVCGVLWARPRFARAGVVGDLSGYFSRQTFWRDFRLFYLQHRPRRRHRRLAWRLSVRYHQELCGTVLDLACMFGGFYIYRIGQ